MPREMATFATSCGALRNTRDGCRDLPHSDFSRDVLARQPEMLAVLPVTGVSWDDLGDPARVLAVRENAASRPTSRDRLRGGTPQEEVGRAMEFSFPE